MFFFCFFLSFSPKVIWRGGGGALHKLGLNLIYKYTRQRDIVSCFLKLITNLSHMLCRHHHKGYNNHTLEPLTKRINKQIYSLQKQRSFHIFLIGTSTDPCFRYRDGQEWQRSSPQSPKPYSLSHALCKSKKIFSLCLTLSCDMYHQTNLDSKSFSISEDLAETIVALTLNIAK